MAEQNTNNQTNNTEETKTGQKVQIPSEQQQQHSAQAVETADATHDSAQTAEETKRDPKVID